MKYIYLSVLTLLLSYFSIAQNIHWVQTGGGTVEESANAVVMDDAGNSYVGGVYRSTSTTFSGTALTYASLTGGADGFLAKYSNSGNLTWIKTYGNLASNFQLRDIVLSPTQDYLVYIGAFSNTTNIGGTTLTSSGSSDVLVVKVDTSGTVIWAKKFGSNAEDRGEKVALDKNGNVFIHGFYRNTISFGSTSLPNQTLKARFIAKLDNNGNAVWAHRIGTLDADMAGSADKEVNGAGFGVAVDSEDNVYFTGMVLGIGQDITAKFDTVTISVPKENRYNIFIAKFNNQGSALWVKSSLGIGRPTVTGGLTIDKQDNLIIGGYADWLDNFGGTTFTNVTTFYLAKFTKEGNITWIKEAASGNSSHGMPEDIAVDGTGNIYASGFYSQSITFGAIKLTASSSAKMYVVRYTPSGDPDWAIDFGKRQAGTMYENALGICVNSAGMVNVVGKFDQVDEVFGPFKASSAGGLDAFNMRISPFPLSNSAGSEAASAVELYPNPSSTFIHVVQATGTIEVFTLDGRKIASKSIIDHKVDVSDLTPATYLVRVNNTSSMISIER